MSPRQRQPPGTPSRSPLATVSASAVKSSHSQTTPRSRCTQRPLGMTSKQENILEDCLAAQREVNKGLFDNIGESNKILGDNIGESNKILGDNAGESNKNISRMLDIAFSPGLTPKQESILEDLIAAQREANKILGDNIGQANKILGDNIGQGNDNLRRMLDIHFNVNSEAIAESTAVSLAANRAAVTEMLSPDRSAKRSNENHVHTSSVAASHACASQDDLSGPPCNKRKRSCDAAPVASANTVLSPTPATVASGTFTAWKADAAADTVPSTFRGVGINSTPAPVASGATSALPFGPVGIRPTPAPVASSSRFRHGRAEAPWLTYTESVAAGASTTGGFSAAPVTATAPPVQQYSSFGSTSSGIAAPAGSVAPSGGDSSSRPSKRKASGNIHRSSSRTNGRLYQSPSSKPQELVEPTKIHAPFSAHSLFRRPPSSPSQEEGKSSSSCSSSEKQKSYHQTFH